MSEIQPKCTRPAKAEIIQSEPKVQSEPEALKPGQCEFCQKSMTKQNNIQMWDNLTASQKTIQAWICEPCDREAMKIF